jgi:hypothetical protein
MIEVQRGLRMRGGYRRRHRGGLSLSKDQYLNTPRYESHGKKYPSIWDIRLQRLSHLSQFGGLISQIGVLILGIWGLTQVVPLFEYQKLERTSEQLKAEKSRLSNQLASLNIEKEGVTQDILSLKGRMRIEQEKSMSLRGQVSLLKNEEQLAKQLLSQTQVDLKTNLAALDYARWELILNDMGAQLLHYQFVRSPQFSSELNNPGAAIKKAEEWWPNPAEELLSSVDNIANKREAPSAYYTELKALISARLDKLQCKKPDFQSLRKEHSDRYNKIDSEVKTEVETYINELKAKYAGESKSLLITDEFVKDATRKFTNQKRISLEADITSRLMDLRFECEGKSDKVLQEIAKLKSVTI